MVAASVQAADFDYNKSWEIGGAEKSIISIQAFRIFNPVFFRNVTFNIIAPRTNVILYRVSEGENLDRIAFRSGCTVQELIEINNLNSCTVTPGQALIIIQKKQIVHNPGKKTAEKKEDLLTELELVPESKPDIPSPESKAVSDPKPASRNDPKQKPDDLQNKEPNLAAEAEPEPEPDPDPDPVPKEKVDPNLSKLTSDEQNMFNLVNQARAQQGLKPLKIDMDLVKLARLKSQDMVDHDYFSHHSPTYGSPFDMMNDAGIIYKKAAENIAGNSSVKGAHTSLMNSSGHRANILNPDFTHIGIGIVNGSKYGKIFTQMFIQK